MGDVTGGGARRVLLRRPARDVRVGRPAVAIAFVLLLFVVSCDPVTVLDARTIEVLIEAEPGATVRTVTSREFGVAAEGPFTVVLITADTTDVPTPHSASFDVREQRLLLVRLIGTSPEGLDPIFSVWIDGDLVQRTEGFPEGRPYIEFVYMGGN